MSDTSDRIILDVNVAAPEFECTDIFGRKINLQDYKGKKVFIGFVILQAAHFVIYEFMLCRKCIRN